MILYFTQEYPLLYHDYDTYESQQIAYIILYTKCWLWIWILEARDGSGVTSFLFPFCSSPALLHMHFIGISRYCMDGLHHRVDKNKIEPFSLLNVMILTSTNYVIVDL